MAAYNRHRSYDPHSGRFASRDPIKLKGGLNIHTYAPNPIGWIDPLGLAGSGPASGFVEISNAYPSTVIITNFQSQRGSDFVFDPVTNRMVVGNNFMGHEGIAKAMGIPESERGRIVAGTIYRDKNGQLVTNEHSGHYGHQWDDARREQFENFKKCRCLDIAHSPTWGRQGTRNRRRR